MVSAFRPLLAATIKSVDDLSRLTFPLLASPKLDGIRCLIIDGGPASRKLKAIPNRHIYQSLYCQGIFGLDGEIMIDGGFSAVASAVMSQDGTPDFTYWVFDWFGSPQMPYVERYNTAREICERCTNVSLLPQTRVETVDEVLRAEAMFLTNGSEGIMLRSPSAPYKFNRSTFNEAYLLKFKRFADAEAICIGVEELMQNDNEATLDERGYTKRSQSQHGLTPTGRLGALILRSPDFANDFKVGTGFDDYARITLWVKRGALIGREVKFRYQDVGVNDRPRFPSFIEVRQD